MNSLSETQLVVGQQHDFQLQIAQKILKSKLVHPMLVSRLLLNIALPFWLQLWLQTIQSHVSHCQSLFPSFCFQPSKVAVLFY